MKSLFSKRILGTGLFLILSGMAHADYIYVANWLTDEIYKFDEHGNSTLFATTDYNQPKALAFDRSGNLYASVSLAGEIQKFDSHGNSSVFGSAGLNQPNSLAFDKSGNLYVANLFGNNIIKFDPQGNASVFSSFGGSSAAVGLAFDSKGNLFGAFGGASEVLKFDANGNQSIFTFLPSSCYYLAIDQNDFLYASSQQGPIYKIDSHGTVSTFANGTAIDTGIAFDSSGNLYAVQDQQIVKYDPHGNASLFATGMPKYLTGIAIQSVPEPAVCGMLAVGAGAFFASRRLRRPQG
jgi:sugar lactone lactonase YvrE